jgi:hypothetical protein
MQIKLFTMVKDEEDILDDWVIYHGSIFGFPNIFVIDNYSTDGTYEKLLEFKKIGVNVFRGPDYSLKGQYMTNLINKHCVNHDIAYPIDIDEFIVYYDRSSKNVWVDKTLIINYMNQLPKNVPLFKTNYIQALPTNEDGFSRATVECNTGIYDDCGSHAKTFIRKRLFRNTIDHGNHVFSNHYFLTDLCLVHFHYRNINQMKKKIYNNVNGFGYPVNDINRLKNLLQDTPGLRGFHHVRNQIEVLENRFKLNRIDKNDPNIIHISRLNQRIQEGYF